jgi:sterol desaturase/sphingolipid hydroxylase (fatty acid hydroxylase superfamily)
MLTWKELIELLHTKTVTFTNTDISNRTLFVVVSWIIIFVMNYLHAWFFVMADWYGFLDKYAIRSGKKRLPSMDKQWVAINEASVDLFLIKPLLLYFTYPYITEPFVIFGNAPAIGEMFGDWLLMSIYFSTSLYFIHGAMHRSSFLYKHIHKRHHSYHATVGFAAQYAHPLEGLASSMHVVGALVFVQPHFITYCLFLATTMTEIVDSHCGYDVPWSFLFPWAGCYPWGAGALMHDYHHSHNLGTYGGGLLGLWDWLFGTDADYRAFCTKAVVSRGSAEKLE